MHPGRPPTHDLRRGDASRDLANPEMSPSVAGTATLIRDGLTLRALAWGPRDGELVVLQHGRGGDAMTWTAVSAHLTRPARRSNRVLAPELRGHGGSDWDPQRRYEVDVLAEDLADWIHRHGTGCVLVGHSYGAAVALATAARYPDTVRALVLEDGGPAGQVLIQRWGDPASRPVPRSWFPTADTAEAELERLYPGSATAEDRDLRLARFFRPAGGGGLNWRCDMPGMAEAPRDPLMLERSWGLLDSIRCPLTLVVAGEGSMLDPDVGDRVRARVRDVTVVQVPEAGHAVHRDQPDRYCRVLDDVLDDVLDRVTLAESATRSDEPAV